MLLFARSSNGYRERKDRQEVLRLRIRDIASTRVRYGYRRIYVLLRREGWKVNHKRVHRLYRLEGTEPPDTGQEEEDTDIAEARCTEGNESERELVHGFCLRRAV